MRSTGAIIVTGLASIVLAAGIAIAGVGEIAKLLPIDGDGFDEFGYSVGISGTIAIVGAHLSDDNGIDSGSAYVFDTNTGLQTAKLLPDDGAASDEFGVSVAVSGATAIVGAWLDGDSGIRAGSAYVFDTTTGMQMAKLIPNDGTANDLFGWSVGISDTTAIVGAYGNDDNGINSGSAYIFDTTTGLQTAKLLPDDGAANDYFGWSVAISGTTAIVGAWLHDSIAQKSNSGAAYVFDAASGLQIAKLVPNDLDSGDAFGISVAISGTTAIIGAYHDDDNGTFSGSSYVFNAITGLQTAKLLPSDGADSDLFGRTVSISGTIAVIGALRDDDGATDSGSAYLYDVAAGQQIEKLLPRDGAASDFFSGSVALSGRTAIIGAYLDDDNGIDSGSAYIFDTTCDEEPASTTVRNGSGLNAVILTRASDPVIGTNWETDLDCSGHSPAFATLEVYEQPFSGFFLPGGELLVDPSSPLALRTAEIHFGNVIRFSIAVPNDTDLCGFTASAQGVVLGSPGYELSNALDLVAGF